MAHSTRRKLKAARGGKTRHQALKALRATQYSSADKQARIRELEDWQETLRKNKGKTPEEAPKGPIKRTRRSSTKSSYRERQQKTLDRLTTQLTVGYKQPKGGILTLDMVPLEEKDRTRIEAEIKKLISKGLKQTIKK